MVISPRSGAHEGGIMIGDHWLDYVVLIPCVILMVVGLTLQFIGIIGLFIR